MKALIIDEDPAMLEALQYNLCKEGYAVLTATDADEGLTLFEKHRPDLVLLEVVLPTIDGLQLCRQLREASDAPILLVTGRASEEDRILGLEQGADDYITKPFNMRELMARVRAVRRRHLLAQASQRQLRVGGLSLYLDRQEVRVRGKRIRLSSAELTLLQFLALRPGQAYSLKALRDRICGKDERIKPGAMGKRLEKLREKIEADPTRPEYILDVEGKQFYFRR